MQFLFESLVMIVSQLFGLLQVMMLSMSLAYSSGLSWFGILPLSW